VPLQRRVKTGAVKVVVPVAPLKVATTPCGDAAIVSTSPIPIEVSATVEGAISDGKSAALSRAIGIVAVGIVGAAGSVVEGDVVVCGEGAVVGCVDGVAESVGDGDGVGSAVGSGVASTGSDSIRILVVRT